MMDKLIGEALSNKGFTVNANFELNHYEVLYNNKEVGSFNPYHGYINLFSANHDDMPKMLTITHVRQLSDMFDLKVIE